MKVEMTRHQVAIAGNVTDAQTGKAIARARVEITAGPAAFTDWLALHAKQYANRWAAMAERLDRTHTQADGHFHFLDLPDGDYTLTASLPGSGTRYASAEARVSVSSDGEGNITMARADIALPPTALRGQITDQADGEPVLLAEVRVKGSGERTFSDGDGAYLLAGLEAGERTVQVSAQGYETATSTVQLSQGETLELNVAL